MTTTNFNLLRNVRSKVGQAMDKRDQLQATSAQLSAQVASFEAAATVAQASGDVRAAQAAERGADAARQKRSGITDRVTEIDNHLRDELGRLVNIVDPCDAEADVPLALFPVRLETRYTDDGGSLRIRVYPDDIHVDQLDRGLSDDETSAGRAYWMAVWETDDAEVSAAAYRALSALVHPDRAAWVATALTPNNLVDAGHAAPDFPTPGARGRRPAVARLLPDRFVAIAVQSQSRSTATGLPIAPELTVGLLSDNGTPLVEQANGLTVPAGAEWIYDYNAALAQGMAITLPLAERGAPITQLFVVGVRGSFDTQRSAGAFEQLLQSHRYTRGLAIIPQGTPTNNTESDRAAWQDAVVTRAAGRAPFVAPASGTNADVVSRAFGIDPSAFADVDHANEREQPQAAAMNVALWAPSWGTMLESITTDLHGTHISDVTREGARTFFTGSVRGRGPVPALRVGNQPYGVLPVSATESRWRIRQSEAFENTVLGLLRKIRLAWRNSLVNVPRVDANAAAVDETVLDILRSAPIAQGLRVRSVLASTFPDFVSQATGGETDTQHLERIIGQIVLQEAIGNFSFAHPAGSLGKDSRPLPLPFTHVSDGPFIDAVLAGAKRPVASVLQALLELSWNAATLEVQQAAPPQQVPRLVESAALLPDALREQVLTIHSSIATTSATMLHAAANAVAAVVGEAGPALLAAHAPIPALRTSLAELALDSPSQSAASGLFAQSIGAWLRAEAHFSELRSALAELRAIGDDAAAVETRRILLAETLDLASHRFDAWMSGVVENRRATLRAAKPTGIMIGAYGWVENLSRGGGASHDGGYIHAPSIAHAATAGLLRNAYLTHNPDATGNGAFAVDLSSTRVRSAIALLDGLREGQSLGALLGYRIERVLQEQRLERLALSLRALAPLVGGQLTTHNVVVPPEATESIAAANVVDGLRLIGLFQANPASVLSALDTAPLNNPFIPAGTWPALTPAERGIVTGAINAAIDDNDALADLVLAEGVHQLVQGNAGRAAAALDGGGSGEAPVIEPTVVQTPAQGIPYTHRLMIIAAGRGEPWNTDRPRAMAEPRLEQWAATRLGSAADVVVHMADDGTLTRLDAARFAALDLLYESGDRTRMEQAIRAAIPTIPADEPLAMVRDPAWPAASRSIFEIVELAASLREMIVRARIANPADFVRSPDAPSRVVPVAELNDLSARAMEARAGLAASLADLEAVLAPADNSPPDEAKLGTALEAIAAYGIATPHMQGTLHDAMARVVAAEAHKRLDAADALLAVPLEAPMAGTLSQALFGAGFWMIPALSPGAAGDLFAPALDAAAGAVAPANGAIRRFVRDVASVRDAVARCAETLLLGDALGRKVGMRVAQLARTGTPGVDHWIGGTLDAAQATPAEPVTNIVLEAPSDYDGLSLDAALVIDQWVDVVPHRAVRGEGDATVIDERVVSGLAVNAPAAAARAPQAILLAISPDGARWTTDALVDTLADTLDLARLRGITLERTTGAARVLPALYEQSASLQGSAVLDVREVWKEPIWAAVLPYVKETKA